MKPSKVFSLVSLIIFIVLATSLKGVAHQGGTDDFGCHRNHKQGGYHCHKGPYEGLKFKNKAEGLKYFQQRPATDQTPPNPSKKTSRTTPPDIATLYQSTTSEEILVGSWNVKRLGRERMDFERMAPLIKNLDIITFQEVNTTASGKEALNRMANELNRLTGEKICQAWSEIPTGARERYAYIWKNQKISYVRTDGTIIKDCPDSAITIRLGVKNAHHIVREPAFGTFYAKGPKHHFVLASIHLVPEAKRPEAEVGPLFDTFREVNVPTIIAGDFNLDSSHSAFDAPKKLGFRGAMAGVATSLKRKARELNKPLDNFFVRNIGITSVDVINLYQVLPDLDKKDIYNKISDHSPIVGKFSFSKTPVAVAEQSSRENPKFLKNQNGDPNE